MIRIVTDGSVFRWQQGRVVEQCVEQAAHDDAGVVRVRLHAFVLVETHAQQAFQLDVLFAHCRGEVDDRLRRRANFIEITWREFREAMFRRLNQIDHEIIQHLSNHTVENSLRIAVLPAQQGRRVQVAKQWKPGHLLYAQQVRAQTIVDVVVIVGYFVRDIGDLRLESRLRPMDKAQTEWSECSRPFRAAVLQDPFARFEQQVQPAKIGITLFQVLDDAQRLEIMLEAAERFHTGVQGVLPRVAERGVPEVVRERDRLGQILVQSQRPRHAARNLRNFERVREAGAKHVPFMIHEHLGLVFEPAKRGTVDNAVAVALKLGAKRRRSFGVLASARLFERNRIRGRHRWFSHL